MCECMPKSFIMISCVLIIHTITRLCIYVNKVLVLHVLTLQYIYIFTYVNFSGKYVNINLFENCN